MSTEKQDKVIRLIRKLLDLAGGNANEHEARSAAEKAHALLLEHNLDMQAVKAAGQETGDEYVKHEGYTAAKRTTQQKFILILLQKFFFVRVVRSRTQRGGPVSFFFLGTKTNVEIAQYVHDFLNLKFPELWRQYKNANHLPENAKQSYYAGLALGLEEQLTESKRKVETSRALVLVEDPALGKFVANVYPRLSTGGMTPPKLNNSAAMAAGHEEGRKLRITRGITTTSNGGPVLRIGGRK